VLTAPTALWNSRKPQFWDSGEDVTTRGPRGIYTLPEQWFTKQQGTTWISKETKQCSYPRATFHRFPKMVSPGFLKTCFICTEDNIKLDL
jgi:hypothetical protein